MAQHADARAKQRDDFEIDLKLVVRKYFEMGNVAMEELDLNEGDPGDFGFINEDDIVSILRKAAKQMDVRKGAAPLDWLYHHPPQPETKKSAHRAKAGR
jgi:hypothetical protein